MAWITGIWLLVLVGEMIAKYGFGVDDFALDRRRPRLDRVLRLPDLLHRPGDQGALGIRQNAGTALAGTIPFLSFYVEHIRTRAT